MSAYMKSHSISYVILGDIFKSLQEVRSSEDGILKLGPQATDALFLKDGYFVLKFWSFGSDPGRRC